ncbi:MAG TPA: zinc-dependent alcohol dehydrogenase [Yinghuangia sp.]|uniref:zinc-dependent alcohol dehydrogenase n=1 Tax=Yinghuangia sp. YIM S10712 TaxID=3436930 RepID=UPI002CA38E32|nr:zinc-dependent alcohol dehydrogenase [Yinghuangia sp.]
MKAVVWHGIGDIRLDDVPDPGVQDPTDAVVRVTTSAICGTDLHMVRGTMPGMVEGTVLGHEAVGVVEAVGKGVRNLEPGRRVIVPSTIACGSCSYCRAGYYAQCDNANPHGRRAGTAFFGGPEATGPIDGLQAEYARVPFANIGLVPVPDSVSDDQAILLSDIFPTAWYGTELAEVSPGDTVAVFGAGPVGLFCVVSAYLRGAARVFCVDHRPARLSLARSLHAETIDFSAEDPVATIVELTRGTGVDRTIDAVGVDSERAPDAGGSEASEFDRELAELLNGQGAPGPTWVAGDGPSQAIRWAVDAVAKAGTVGVVGVYPQGMDAFPLGTAMNKNLTLKMGNCNHRGYIPELLGMVATGRVDPSPILTRHCRFDGVLEAYEHFDHRDDEWTKVALTT